MIVIKRDGKRKVLFNKSKIITAIGKAMAEVGDVDLGAAGTIADNIEAEMSDVCDRAGKTSVSVEDIQDAVEKELMRFGFDKVAKAYILYRDEHNRRRELNASIINKVMSRIDAKDVQNSNANVDEKSFSGREKEASSDIQKEIALEMNMSYDVAKAHKDGWIYQHDLDKFNIGEHNCLFVDFEHVFDNGFWTRNGDVRQPGSLSTACQQMAVIMQVQSQVQYGGVATSHIDFDLAKYVRKSFYKYLKDGLVYIAGLSTDDAKEIVEQIEDRGVGDILANKEIVNRPAAIRTSKPVSGVVEYALDMLEREGTQSFEALYHNLNTLESRAGSQVPFTSINTGRDTSWEGRFVTRHVLEASLSGIGNHHLTSIFPISIFQWKVGDNANKGDKNYDLKQLALKSMSKRIYPNWANCNWSQANEDVDDKDTFFATIGYCGFVR